MSDAPNKNSRPGSRSKPPAASAASAATVTAPEGRPRTVQAAVAAMVVSAVAALVAALSLYGLRDWLTHEQRKSNAKTVAQAGRDAVDKATKNHDTAAQIAAAKAKAIAKATRDLPDLHNQVSRQQSGALISGIIVVAALGFIAYSVYRGRHWSRWAVLGLWFLASFTGTTVGIVSVLSVGSSAPAGFKIPSFLAGLALIVAVVLVNMRPSIAFFALNKPVPSPDAPARRGLFAPRTPPAAGKASPAIRPAAGRTREGAKAKSVLTSNAASRGDAFVERQRSKKRAAANADSVARGAELARSRAKASKSRRIES